VFRATALVSFSIHVTRHYAVTKQAYRAIREGGLDALQGE